MCKHEFNLIREHGEQLQITNLQELQEQAAGRNLYALVEVPNNILADYLCTEPTVIEDLDSQKLSDLQTLPDWISVGVYAMDRSVLLKLHGEAHLEELRSLTDTLGKQELEGPLAQLFEGFGDNFGGDFPFPFGKI